MYRDNRNNLEIKKVLTFSFFTGLREKCVEHKYPYQDLQEETVIHQMHTCITNFSAQFIMACLVIINLYLW